MRSALVLVASTRAAAGVYPDKSGPILVSWLRSRGLNTPDATIVADAELSSHLPDLLFDRPNLPSVLLISGGTGLTADDQTVDILLPFLDKEIPGIAHAFWNLGMTKIPTAVLSRTLAGTIGNTFVMALPGSSGAAADATEILDPLLDHLISSLEGNLEH